MQENYYFFIITEKKLSKLHYSTKLKFFNNCRKNPADYRSRANK